MPNKLAKSGSVKVPKLLVSSTGDVWSIYWTVPLSRIIVWKAAASTIDTRGAEVNGRGVGASSAISIEGAGSGKDISNIDEGRAGDAGNSVISVTGETATGSGIVSRSVNTSGLNFSEVLRQSINRL
jgi:hypothetical protein